VEGVLQGKNGSVFCYGATGAGKTHTMLGTLQSPGIMVLALKDLFAKIKQRSKDGDYEYDFRILKCTTRWFVICFLLVDLSSFDKILSR
jgi:kinesin family protein 18/19